MTAQTEAQTLIDDCIAREERLNDWERTFLDSIGRQVADGRSLSPKQAEALSSVWQRVTSERTGVRRP